MIKKSQDMRQALLSSQVEDSGWPTVIGYLKCVNFLDSSQPQCHSVLEIDDVKSQIGLKATRVRFLNGNHLI